MSAGTSAALWLLFVSIVFVSAEQKTITADPGQNVTLTCRAQEGKTIRAVEWSRADLGDEYVLLYKDGQFVSKEQHPSFKNRVDLQDRQMKDGDVSVILKDVMINDEGTYKCRAFMGQTLSWEPIINITLSVVAPPGPTGGTTEDGGKKNGGKEDGAVGLIVGLIVSAVFLVISLVVFLIYRKHKKTILGSSQPPAEL